MIHIVSGFMRSGTSCMMAALIAGGMTAEWSRERDVVASARADELYHPNQSGLYEVSLKEYTEVTFPLRYQGKLIKVMSWGLDGLAVNPHGYRVVLMCRDPEEIRQSYEAFFGRPLRMPWFGQYAERMERAVKMLRNRNDVLSVDLVQHRSLMEQPLRVLGSLSIDWPFDPAKAAEVVDMNQWRFRREILTAGI